MTSLIATPQRLTFTSHCVDVIHLESPAYEERYRLIVRDCSARCYWTSHCPDWIRALASIGDWAATQEPECYVQMDDHEEYDLSRLVLATPCADVYLPHDHWGLEYSSLKAAMQHASGSLQLALDLGEMVFLFLGPAETQAAIAHLDVDLKHPRLVFGDSPTIVQSCRLPDGSMTLDSVLASPPVRVIRRLAEAGVKMRFLSSHLTPLMEKGAYDDCHTMSSAINQLTDEQGISCTCLLPEAPTDLSPDYFECYSRLTKTHARMTVV